MTTLAQLAERIKAERRARGLTQCALAEASGVSRGRIDAIENERAGELQLGTVSSLLAVLGLELTVVPSARKV